MKALITPLYRKGLKIPILRDKKIKVYNGDLNLRESINPVLNRLVTEANLLTETGLNEIDPIRELRILAIAGDGLLLRGVEYGNRGIEQTQEWWVRFPIFRFPE